MEKATSRNHIRKLTCPDSTDKRIDSDAFAVTESGQVIRRAEKFDKEMYEGMLKTANELRLTTKKCFICGKLLTAKEAKQSKACPACLDALRHNLPDSTEVSIEEVQAEVLANQMAENDTRSHNVGESDYSKHKIQPWDIWIEYKLNPFDADIIKRVLRHKKTDTRKMDYEKIIHICQERIRQIDSSEDVWEDKND